MFMFFAKAIHTVLLATATRRPERERVKLLRDIAWKGLDKRRFDERRADANADSSGSFSVLDPLGQPGPCDVGSREPSF